MQGGLSLPRMQQSKSEGEKDLYSLTVLVKEELLGRIVINLICIAIETLISFIFSNSLPNSQVDDEV